MNKNSVCWTPNPDCKNSTYCSASYFFPLWHTSFLTNPEAGKWTLSTFTFSFPCSFGLPCMEAIKCAEYLWLTDDDDHQNASAAGCLQSSHCAISFFFTLNLFLARPSNIVPCLSSESYFLTGRYFCCRCSCLHRNWILMWCRQVYSIKVSADIMH